MAHHNLCFFFFFFEIPLYSYSGGDIRDTWDTTYLRTTEVKCKEGKDHWEGGKSQSMLKGQEGNHNVKGERVEGTFKHR